eukprot:1659742-Pleurochrysis_carterae.AAC.3
MPKMCSACRKTDSYMRGTHLKHEYGFFIIMIAPDRRFLVWNAECFSGPGQKLPELNVQSREDFYETSMISSYTRYRFTIFRQASFARAGDQGEEPRP